MQLIRDARAMRDWSRTARSEGARVGFVPTMGFLHEGHLSLMRIAHEHADRVVVSIFVNPTQFAPGEDLDRYPRDEEGDLAGCRAQGVDAVFLPPVEQMYPPGSETLVTPGGLARELCGQSRPTHFRGVATVVSMLFNIVEPDAAVFGEKDFQQLCVIQRMVRDLAFPLTIVPGPIVREPDGLAMSSRNAYLGTDQRSQAVVLNRSLRAAAERVGAGERDCAALVAGVRETIGEQPLAEIDYVELVDAGTLLPVSGQLADPARLAVAVRFGATRLIDNIQLTPAAP